MARITKKLLGSLKPGKDIRFERDDTLAGFGAKVYPSGRISFFVEGRIRGGRTRRKTLGQHPAMSVDKAREQARDYLASMQQGEDPILKKRQEVAKAEALGKTVGAVFEGYMSARDLKPKTAQDYRNTFNLVFEDWSKRPIRSVTRQDAEEKFVETRDNRGLPTASKAFRIISAVFSFAMADEVSESA